VKLVSAGTPNTGAAYRYLVEARSDVRYVVDYCVGEAGSLWVQVGHCDNAGGVTMDPPFPGELIPWIVRGWCRMGQRMGEGPQYPEVWGDGAVTRVPDEDQDVWTYVFEGRQPDDRLVERMLDLLASGATLGSYVVEGLEDLQHPTDPEWSLERYLHAAHHAPWNLSEDERAHRHMMLDADSWGEEDPNEVLSLTPRMTLAILTVLRGRRG